MGQWRPLGAAALMYLERARRHRWVHANSWAWLVNLPGRIRWRQLRRDNRRYEGQPQGRAESRVALQSVEG